jgi:HEPN domain-containing protein
VYYNEEIPRIHDLFRLLELCAEHTPKILDLSIQANRLTKYSTITRYPNEIELEEEDMELALEYAEQIINTVVLILIY